MINVSSTFKDAARNGRTRILLTMDNRIIENADILSDGITVTENLGPDNTSYTIGNAPAGTIGFSLMNGDGRFSNLSYGELKAVGYATSGTWGSAISGLPSGTDAFCKSDYSEGTNGYICAVDDALKDDDGTSIYSFASLDGAELIYIRGGRVYAYGDSAASFGYIGDGSWASANIAWNEWASVTWASTSDIYGVELTASITDSDMLRRLSDMIADRYNKTVCGRYDSDSAIYEFSTDFCQLTWEGCPIGIYDIDKPTQTSGKTIECTGYGLMARLDNIEMDDYTALFPIDNRTLLARIAADAGLGWSYTTDQAVTFSENYWSGYTARQFIKDCAALDAANAIVDRNGNLTFRRPSASGQSYSESDYSSIEIAEYSVPAITGVAWKQSESDVGYNSGTDSEVLTILENSTLDDCSESAKQTVIDWILGKVDDVAAYHPIEANLWCGWHLEAGDIVTIVRNSVSYSIPIFGIEYTITTGCRAVVSATGEEHRNDLMETNREQYVSNKKRYELSKTVDGLLSAVYDENGNSKIEQQAGLISACVTKTGGSSSSFGWELTASSWSLKSNGTEVLKVDSSGLTVRGAVYASSGSFTGEVTCSKLTVGGQDYSVSALQQIFSGGSTAYSNNGYWTSAYSWTSSNGNYAYNGGTFASYCYGSSYSSKCVDASYLRMPYNSATVVCTISPITINGHLYYIPCAD